LVSTKTRAQHTENPFESATLNVLVARHVQGCFDAEKTRLEALSWQQWQHPTTGHRVILSPARARTPCDTTLAPRRRTSAVAPRSSFGLAQIERHMLPSDAVVITRARPFFVNERIFRRGWRRGFAATGRALVDDNRRRRFVLRGDVARQLQVRFATAPLHDDVSILPDSISAHERRRRANARAALRRPGELQGLH